ncbi:hypothetical protein [Hyphomicrobium sp.]|uniref:hypothetical protein n=1 Tax=Hyphomicrobium sp. TaxID=82 RepID=UPI000FB3AA7C|nr:hypothetical protein [Hyphomicrobium sp.]RUP10232.1 MAG: hypothetical protein EKK38_07325 [Hyphomicrobium sp.]
MPVDQIENWTQQTVSAFLTLGRAEIISAARSWLRAEATFEGATIPVPVIAASRSNAGIAHLILENTSEADVAFREAEEHWRQAIESVATLDVPLTGTSSFHFRLAAKVPHALMEARRQRYRHLTEGARAITRFNHLFVDGANLTSGLIANRTSELASILSEILGPGSAEVCLLTMTGASLHDAATFSPYGRKSAEFAHSPPALANGLSSDRAILEAAVALTALLGLPAFLAIEHQRKAAETHSQCPNLT